MPFACRVAEAASVGNSAVDPPQTWRYKLLLYIEMPAVEKTALVRGRPRCEEEPLLRRTAPAVEGGNRATERSPVLVFLCFLCISIEQCCYLLVFLVS